MTKNKEGKLTGEWEGKWGFQDDLGNLIISDMSGWHFWYPYGNIEIL